MFQALRQSALAKVIALVLLTLLLCIPLSEIGSLIGEREGSQRMAAEELASTYAGEQTLAGPFIVLPWTEQWTETERDSKGTVIGQAVRTKVRTTLLFPEQLKIDGSLTPQERYRGIFRVLFYRLDARLGGRFGAAGAPPAPTERNSRLTRGTPLLAFSLSDVRGIEGMPAATLGTETLKFQQGIPGVGGRGGAPQGIHAPLTGAALKAIGDGQPLDFALDLKVVGHEQLNIVPAAESTEAHLTSPWPHPSFGGRFLAAERTVGDNGFDARWRVSSLVSTARAQLVQHWSAEPMAMAVAPADVACGDRDNACVRTAAAAATAAVQVAAGGPQGVDTFGVALVQPVNVYSMGLRAVKYGALIIGLVLMSAFMFELFRKLRLHPVQYGLVGLSIALFFLLLMAFSEKLLFWQAYAVAAGASVLLLVVYFSAVLRGWRRGLGLGAFVAVLYGALYGLLASENNALLLGALLTFGMLALLMLATRNVDWYALSDRGTPPPSPPSTPASTGVAGAVPLPN